MAITYGSARNGKLTNVRYTHTQIQSQSVIDEIISRGFTIHALDDPARGIRELTVREIASEINYSSDLEKVLYEYAENVPGGVVSLRSNGKIDNDDLPESAVEYKGVWDPITNEPMLMDGYGRTGDSYSVIGCDDGTTIDLGSGLITVQTDDVILYRKGRYTVSSSPNLSRADRALLHNTMQNVSRPVIISPLDKIEIIKGSHKSMQIMVNTPTNTGEFHMVDNGGLTNVILHPISGEIYINTTKDDKRRHVVKMAFGGVLGQVTDFEIYIDIL